MQDKLQLLKDNGIELVNGKIRIQDKEKALAILSKAQNSEAGQNGDWKEDGYTFHVSNLSKEDVEGWKHFLNTDSWGCLYLVDKDGKKYNDHECEGVEMSKAIGYELVKSGECVHDMGVKYPFVYCLSKSGQLVGFAIVGSSEIIGNFVDPKHRRKGIASQMHTELEKANDHKIKEGSLSEDGEKLWVGKENKAAASTEEKQVALAKPEEIIDLMCQESNSTGYFNHPLRNPSRYYKHVAAMCTAADKALANIVTQYPYFVTMSYLDSEESSIDAHTLNSTITLNDGPRDVMQKAEAFFEKKINAWQSSKECEASKEKYEAKAEALPTIAGEVVPLLIDVEKQYVSYFNDYNNESSKSNFLRYVESQLGCTVDWDEDGCFLVYAPKSKKKEVEKEFAKYLPNLIAASFEEENPYSSELSKKACGKKFEAKITKIKACVYKSGHSEVYAEITDQQAPNELYGCTLIGEMIKNGFIHGLAVDDSVHIALSIAPRSIRIKSIEKAEGSFFSPVTKYDMIENGAHEFSDEQLEAFDAKPLTESTPIQDKEKVPDAVVESVGTAEEEAEAKLVLKEYGAYSEMVAAAYAAAPTSDSDMTGSYAALAEHNEKMFHQMLSKIDIEFQEEDSYKSFKQLKKAVEETGILKVHTGGGAHPMWSDEQNWKFRAVHDILGHLAGTGHSFSLRGEIAAYNQHLKIIPTAAIPALFTEVVGQVCSYYVNKSYPEQKACYLHGFDFEKIGATDAEEYKLNFSEEPVEAGLKERVHNKLEAVALIQEAYKNGEESKYDGMEFFNHNDEKLFVCQVIAEEGQFMLIYENPDLSNEFIDFK